MVKPGERAWAVTCVSGASAAGRHLAPCARGLSTGLFMGLPAGVTRDYNSEHVSASAVDLGRDQMAGTARMNGGVCWPLDDTGCARRRAATGRAVPVRCLRSPRRRVVTGAATGVCAPG